MSQSACWFRFCISLNSYLTALVQTTCGRKNWPLDKLVFFTFVTQYIEAMEITEGLEDSCYISGLYLEGAACDKTNNVLTRQGPKTLVTQLPIMQVVPIEGSKFKLQGTFKTPVYITQMRRNAKGERLVFEVDLSSVDRASLWVRQGVTLCLNIDI